MNKKSEKNIYFKDFVPFSFKKIGKKYLLVNEWGDYLILPKDEFLKIEKFNHNDKRPSRISNKLYKKLHSKNFLVKKLDLNKLVKEYREKNKDLLVGPSDFDIFINDRQDGPKKITRKIIDKILSKIFLTNSRDILIKIRNKKTHADLDIVKYIIKEARKINKKYKKGLKIEIYTEIKLITEDELKYLDNNGVVVNLEFNFLFSGDKKDALKKIKDYYKKVKIINKKIETRSLVILNKKSIEYFKEIVDVHVSAGINEINFRILNKYELNSKEWKKYGFSDKNLINFYSNLLKYLILLNKKGTKIKDNFTETFLRKINKKKLENDSFSSPCSAGINRLTFDLDGNVYLCNNAYRLSLAGENSFSLGSIDSFSLSDIANNKILKTVCIASCNEALPGCDTCIYKPYCGPCPINNYYEHGDPFKQEYKKGRCGFVMGVLDTIFMHLEDSKNNKIVSRLIKQRYLALRSPLPARSATALQVGK